MSPADAIRIGVVVPTRRRPHLLDRALESVRRQTVEPVDVVVVHDEEVVPPHRLADGAGARHLATGGRRGASAARNVGAAEVAGTHVAFLDDDDRWQPTYLARVTEALTASGADLAFGAVERVRGERRRPGPPVPPAMTVAAALGADTGVTGSTIVVGREALARIGGFDEDLPVANDLDFVVRAVAAGLRYATVRERLVEYHEHDGERLTTSLQRAEGLAAFRRKWAAELGRGALRRMDAELLGIRRRAEPNVLRQAALLAHEAWLLGPRASLERLHDLRRWSERPAPKG